MKRSVPRLTVEELQFAILAGAGAYDPKILPEPLACRAQIEPEEAEEAVGYSLGSPISRFIGAIDAAFSHAPEKAKRRSRESCWLDGTRCAFTVVNL